MSVTRLNNGRGAKDQIVSDVAAPTDIEALSNTHTRTHAHPHTLSRVVRWLICSLAVLGVLRDAWTILARLSSFDMTPPKGTAIFGDWDVQHIFGGLRLKPTFLSTFD